MNLLFFCLHLTAFGIIFCELNENLYSDIVSEFYDGGFIQLVAYKSSQNDKILAGNSSNFYKKLKWYSIGNSILIVNKAGNLFQFLRSGFSANIKMLTLEHKKTLAQSIKDIYNIDVGLYQIENLILSSFVCYIPLHDKQDKVNIKGEVSSFEKFPLRIDFEAPIESKEINLFNKSLEESTDNIQLKCELSS
jgi:hypothetical protein